MININEIFQSINGEITAWHQGSLTTFIRFAGCNLSCTYCDAASASEINSKLLPYQIVDIVEKTGCKQVTITGGEPTLQYDELQELLYGLVLALQCKITVETNGTQPIPDILKNHISWVVDYKFNYPHKMIYDNFERCIDNNWLKFVIENRQDLPALENLFSIYPILHKANVAIGTTGNVPHAQIVDFLIDRKLFNCVLNYQIHKKIWPIRKEGKKIL